ncbi:MAG: type II toxin-antitoxin system PemK/MazF family toxin [bacterium]|nr:type II toxin-antitoxin system PemK/MazF family toxin [bacterium]
MINSVWVNRGDIWLVSFDPQVGDEIRKIRPSVVMSQPGIYRYQLHIVVPITTWKPYFEDDFWMVELFPTSQNGLRNHSAANAFQIKSLSSQRFIKRLGNITLDELQELTVAVVLTVGWGIEDM